MQMRVFKGLHIKTIKMVLQYTYATLTPLENSALKVIKRVCGIIRCRDVSIIKCHVLSSGKSHNPSIFFAGFAFLILYKCTLANFYQRHSFWWTTFLFNFMVLFYLSLVTFNGVVTQCLYCNYVSYD